ncbi:MAG: hypothetical protein NWF05_05470 [Candidatus Bathyarchaeota archaeon]|nr:hypothetical protein [Candidatus Bathyarchaeota archaeon]
MSSQLKDRIIAVLEDEHERHPIVTTPLFPKEIAVKAQVNHSTTRVYLKQLLKEGVVIRREGGRYVINPNHGVGGVRLPRVQNLWLSVVDLAVPRSVKRAETFGDVSLKVTFGRKRNRVTAVVGCPAGMDITSCSFAIARFKTVVKEVLGEEVSNLDIWVRNCEFNEDYVGIRLEGLSCVTVKSFMGSLAKIYNKGAGLRAEVKVRPDSVEGILALLRGGVTPYHAVQGVFLVDQRVKELTTAVKWTNRNIQRLSDLLAEFFKQQGIRDLEEGT